METCCETGECVRHKKNRQRRESHARNKDRVNAALRERLATDPEYAEKKRRQAKEFNAKNPRRKKSWDLKACYGITIDDYDRMLAEQDGHCAICPTGPNSARNPRAYLDVDHYGGKGKNAVVRGLLCNACNMGIGKLDHDIDLLEAATAYLRKTNAN